MYKNIKYTHAIADSSHFHARTWLRRGFILDVPIPIKWEIQGVGSVYPQSGGGIPWMVSRTMGDGMILQQILTTVRSKL